MNEGDVASLVGGAMLPGCGEPVVIEDATTGMVATRYADGGEAAAEAALCAAEEGGRAWRALSASRRGAVLTQAARRIAAAGEDLAALESRTAGKPIRDARAEVAKVAEMFAFYAGFADKLFGDVVPVATSHLNIVTREPLDTVVQLTPWNAPIFTAGWQLAPALGAGCAAILKPSELTPQSSIALVRLLHEAGVPDGAVNVVAGLGPTSGQRLVSDERVGKVVFIGSVGTGRRVAAAAAMAGRPALLELGGKSANIVFADADLRRAARAAQGAIFAAAGQSCTAGARLLVERSVYERMVEWVSAGTARLKVGRPDDPATEVGPINNRRQFESVLQTIEAGTADGARLVTGGRTDDRDLARGFFVRPTVFADVTPEMMIARKEIFGPVLCVTPFDTEDEAVALANEGAFDLAGAVWTRDVFRAHRMARAIRAGTVWVNGYRSLSVMSPFGGMRGSGFGRSSGIDVLREYTQAKSVWIETDETAVAPFGYDVP
ncbi:aldehyde dehydrogenase family protein [Acuticoccus sp.]|uniref:aldehyde dehydrogenase family protein n=1 Tax=Acuticoccus sp. TaxID=1904378 RepID=UPI003B52B1D7